MGAFNRRQLELDLTAAAHSCGLPTVLLEIDIDSFERFGRRRGRCRLIMCSSEWGVS